MPVRAHRLALCVYVCSRGVACVQEIRQLGCSVPIVAMTANASERDRVECIACGMDGFLRWGGRGGWVRVGVPLLLQPSGLLLVELLAADAAAGMAESVQPAALLTTLVLLLHLPARPPPFPMLFCSKPVLKEQLSVAIREATQGRRASHGA